ncbi:hypothetical protein FPV67DRAFT_1490630 [Lyophyllum atratum]|nr:hypothetical protein FPV67DRAFT_1490630 [Lyophyllum atratum]
MLHLGVFVSSLSFSTIQLGLGCVRFARIDSISSESWDLLRSRLPSTRQPPGYALLRANIPAMLHLRAFVPTLSFLYHPIGPWMCPLCYGSDSAPPFSWD